MLMRQFSSLIDFVFIDMSFLLVFLSEKRILVRPEKFNCDDFVAVLF